MYRLYVVWSENVFVYAPLVCGLVGNIGTTFFCLFFTFCTFSLSVSAWDYYDASNIASVVIGSHLRARQVGHVILRANSGHLFEFDM